MKEQGRGDEQLQPELSPDWQRLNVIPEDQISTPALTPFATDALRYLDALYRTARRLTRDGHEAEDLVQDTYLKALRFADSFKPGTNMKAWLFRILKNTFINQYRKKASEPELYVLPDDNDFSAANRFIGLNGKQNAPSAEDEILLHYLDEDIAAALQTLPSDYRLVVLLADIEGFSYKEIAQTLDIPIGTVMSRLARGRKGLQHLLRKYGREHGYILD